MKQIKTWAAAFWIGSAGLVLAACSDSAAPLAPATPVIPAPGTPAEPTTPAEPRLVEYTVDDPLINESSGLARSQRRDDVLWTLNDSGGATELYAITTEGRHVATLSITGAPANLDWEDLASYSNGGTPYLLIGDMGDNSAFRPVITFYRVEEPVLAGGTDIEMLSATPTGIYNVAYPEGPRDNESLAVDGVENTAYVISKRDAKPTLYSFSLALPTALFPLMSNLGAINVPRAPADYMGNVDSFNWITAMDFDDALDRAYAASLITGYFWDRAPGESWAQAFAKAPTSFDLPDYSQIEAGTFIRGRRDAVYITSEGAPAPLARITP